MRASPVVHRKQCKENRGRKSFRHRRPRCVGHSRSCRRPGIECFDSSKEWNDADHTKRIAAVAKGPAEYFTGAVRVDPLFQAGDPSRVSGGHVTFEPGARSAWHTHPLGQTLIVTSGLGWAQAEGGPVEEIRPGDVVWFPPGLKHWRPSGLPANSIATRS